MPTDNNLAYISKITHDATSFHELNLYYNYLELEEDGIGIFDEPFKIPFLTGEHSASNNNYKPYESDPLFNEFN